MTDEERNALYRSNIIRTLSVVDDLYSREELERMKTKELEDRFDLKFNVR